VEEARQLDDVPGLERRQPVLAGAADQFPPHRVATASASIGKLTGAAWPYTPKPPALEAGACSRATAIGPFR
jgi:hypothetical protein